MLLSSGTLFCENQLKLKVSLFHCHFLERQQHKHKPTASEIHKKPISYSVLTELLFIMVHGSKMTKIILEAYVKEFSIPIT